MAQPTPQYPPRAYTPHQNAGSPADAFSGSAPAAKRPRLSPTGQSSYGSPNINNLSLPNQVFSSPYIGNQTNGTHPPPPYSMPQPYNPNNSFGHPPSYNSPTTPAPPSSQSPVPVQSPALTQVKDTSPAVMGPPSRPENKPTDVNELEDVLHGVGIDLREEEAVLTRGSKDSSFEEQLRQASGMKYPLARDNVYSQNRPGDRGSFYGAGTFNQQARSAQTEAELQREKVKKTLRTQVEIKQYHMNNSFLLSATVEGIVRREAQKHHVSLPIQERDILKPREPNPQPQQITVNGPDGHDQLKMVQGQPLLGLKNNMVEILSLLSLATEERLRILVEDAATLARARRTGAQGLVPPVMADLAVNKPGVELSKQLPASEEHALPVKKPALKRSYSEFNELFPSSPAPSSKSRPSPVAAALQRMAKAEREAEEARLLKRKKRQEAADAREKNESVGIDTGSPATPGTPGTPGDTAPEPKKSALKKDTAKKAPSEAQQFAASNEALNKAMGFGGKKLSWLKSSAPVSNPYLANRKSEANKAVVKKEEGVGNRVPLTRNWGSLDESGKAGRQLQLRDLIHVMEFDGHEKRALQRAYMRLNGPLQQPPPPPR